MGEKLAPRVAGLKHRIARDGVASVPTGMAPNPTAAPLLFDRALLRARQDRARRIGPATFLFDRVAEDMEERLSAVKRDFSDAVLLYRGSLRGAAIFAGVHASGIRDDRQGDDQRDVNQHEPAP